MKKVIALLVTLTLAFSVCACGQAPQEAPAQQAALVEAAPVEAAPAEAPVEKELEGTITIYTPETDDSIVILEELVTNKYPKVKIEWVNGSIGELIARVEAEKNAPQADIVYGGLSQADGDQYFDLLEPYTSMYADESVVPSNGYYTYYGVQYICLLKNNKLLDELGVDVKGYKDLLQPELKGKIIQADPSASSSAWSQLRNILAVMGDSFGDEKAWDYCKELIKNSDGVVTTSSSKVYNGAYDGEYAVAITYLNPTVMYENISLKPDCEIVFPEEGNTVCGFGAAMVKNCNNPDIAKAVLDIVGSLEYHQRCADEVNSSMANKNVVVTHVAIPNFLPTDLTEVDYVSLGENKADILTKWTDLWAEFA